MNHREKAKLLEVLAGTYDFYGRELSTFAGQVWLQACESFDLEQVTGALSRHLMDPERGAFLPKPSDIVRQLHGTNTDRGLIAWGKVLDAIQRVGAYQTVCFDDGVIHAVVEDMGGWPKLCRGTVDELPFTQRRFCETYRAYAGRPSVAYPARLIGESEQLNGPKGHASAPPLLVGDPKRAAGVLRTGGATPKTQITSAGAAALLALGIDTKGDAA